MLFQELRGGIRIVWEDIHRVFCKITHICSAFQRKTWTLWYSLGNMNTFLARPFNYCRDFNWKVVFFFWNQSTTIHFCILQSSRCILDYHIMGSGALPFTVVPINNNDYRYSVFWVSLYRCYHSFSDGETNIPFMENQLASRFLHHILVMRVLVPFFHGCAYWYTVCLSRLRKLPQIHLFLTKKSTKFREDFVGP